MLRSVLLALGLLIVSALPSVAQFNGCSGGFCTKPASVSAAASYVGPGDIVASAIGWWGLRCYSTAYSGSVVDLTDSATGNTTGTRLQCSGGIVSAVVSGSACTFVTGNACSPIATTCATACNIVTLYDQTGNNNPTVMATNSKRPLLKQGASCPASAARCMFFTSTASQLLRSANTYTTALPVTMVSVAMRTANFTTQQEIGGPDGGCCNQAFFSAANQVNMYDGGGSFTAAATDNALHALQSIFNGTTPNSTWIVDGSATTGGVGTSAANGNMFIGQSNFNTDFLDGYVLEIGFWASAFNATQYGNMNSNLHGANGWNF